MIYTIIISSLLGKGIIAVLLSIIDIKALRMPNKFLYDMVYSKVNITNRNLKTLLNIVLYVFIYGVFIIYVACAVYIAYNGAKFLSIVSDYNRIQQFVMMIPASIVWIYAGISIIFGICVLFVIASPWIVNYYCIKKRIPNIVQIIIDRMDSLLFVITNVFHIIFSVVLVHSIIFNHHWFFTVRFPWNISWFSVCLGIYTLIVYISDYVGKKPKHSFILSLVCSSIILLYGIYIL